VVGTVTQATGSFAIPLYFVPGMAVIAAFAGWSAGKSDISIDNSVP
jgi:hypothetical protein